VQFVTNCQVPRKSPWYWVSGSIVLLAGYVSAMLMVSLLLR
jgi:hypothetical protein